MNLKEFRAESWHYRKRFGQLSGSFIYQKIKLHNQLTKHTNYSLKIPGLKYAFTMRAQSSDLATFDQVFTNRESEIPVEGNPKLIVDAGANIGLTSIAYANRFPDAEIIAIEMEPKNFETLKINTSRYKNIRCLNKALWHEQTFVALSNPEDQEWAYRVKDSPRENEIQIPTITMDEIVNLANDRPVDLLKIDIEGAELELFNATNTNWLKHVRTMAVELHDRFQPGCSDALSRAISRHAHNINQHGEYMIITFTSG